VLWAADCRQRTDGTWYELQNKKLAEGPGGGRCWFGLRVRGGDGRRYGQQTADKERMEVGMTRSWLQGQGAGAAGLGCRSEEVMEGALGSRLQTKNGWHLV